MACASEGGGTMDLGIAAGVGGANALAGSGGIAGMGGAGAAGMAGTGGTTVGPDGTGGTAGAGGTDGTPDAGPVVADAGQADTGTPVEDRPPCMQKASQVIVMGDSYMNWVSHTFPQDLASSYGGPAKGVWDVPNNQGGRMYAIGAWAMGSGGIGLIPDQLGFAVQDDPDIIAGIMTGGGNDILVPGGEWVGGGDCKNSSAMPPAPVCQQILEKAFEAARGLMQDAADAGIRDVVYFFYPSVPQPTLIGGTSPNTILDWAYPQVKELCDDTSMETQGRLRCHFIDTRPIFMGHADWFAPTDIHENSLGSKAIADAIVAVMKDKCIAQPASSGCCTP